jgi:hypothetical protein
MINRTKNISQTMNAVTTTKLLTITAVIFVTAALVTLPYQNQVANAAPMKKYQFFVTLKGVPATNAEDLIMNATVTQGFAPINWQIKTVSNPFEDQVVKFVVKVPSGGNEDSFFICGERVDSGINRCDHHLLSSTGGGGPIRVDYTYP